MSRTNLRDAVNTSGLSEEVAEHLRLTFPRGAPDVAFGGISIARATIVQRDMIERLGEPEDPVQWNVFGTITGSALPPCLLFGDFSTATDDWFIGITASASVLFRDWEAALKRLRDERTLVETLGPWASNALYDTAAAHARRLVASTPECDVAIPYITPRHHLRFGD